MMLRSSAANYIGSQLITLALLQFPICGAIIGWFARETKGWFSRRNACYTPVGGVVLPSGCDPELLIAVTKRRGPPPELRLPGKARQHHRHDAGEEDAVECSSAADGGDG